MNWQSMAFDWNQARAFLATAEEGSLSAAARALGQTQPTLSRQVAGLEENLGVALFERVGRGLELTDTGRELLAHFQAMGEAANRISIAASGQSQAIEGRVCITATDLAATYQLPPIVRHLREIAPGIEIELNASNDLRDLMRREADIAIRHVRPEQPDLIAKLVGEAAAYFYAASDFLDAAGRPQTPEQLSAMDFIGPERPELILSSLNALGLSLTRQNFKTISATGTVIVQLARCGLGVTMLPEEIGAAEPTLERVMPGLGPLHFPVWLVAHRELHTSRRIRLVFDALAAALGESRAVRRPA